MRLRPTLAVTTGLAVAAATVALAQGPARGAAAPTITVSQAVSVAATGPAGTPLATSADARVGVAAWGGSGTLNWALIAGTGSAAAPTRKATGSVTVAGAPDSVEVAVSADGTKAIATWVTGTFSSGYQGFAVAGSIAASTITWGSVSSLGAAGNSGVPVAIASDGTRAVIAALAGQYDSFCRSEDLVARVATISGAALTWGQQATIEGFDTLEYCAAQGPFLALTPSGNRMIVAYNVYDYDSGDNSTTTRVASISGTTITPAAPVSLDANFGPSWIYLSSDGSTALMTGYRDGSSTSMQDYRMDYLATAASVSGSSTTWSQPVLLADEIQPVWMVSDLSSDGRTGVMSWTTGTFNPDTESFENLQASVAALSISTGALTKGSASSLGAGSLAASVSLSGDGSRMLLGHSTSSGAALRTGSISGASLTLSTALSITTDSTANHVEASISADGSTALVMWRGTSGQTTPLTARGASLGSTGSNPTISGMSPSSGKVDATTSATISGSGFAQGATVTVGGKRATVTNVTTTKITVTVPAGAAKGRVSVVVANPGGGSATTQFTYLGRSSRSIDFTGTSTTLSSSARTAVSTLANQIKSARFIVVTGYATGTNQAARRVANDRASAVASLLRDRGVTVVASSGTAGSGQRPRVVVEWYS